MAAYHEASQHGIDLVEAIRLAANCSSGVSPTIGKVITDLGTSKQSNGASKDYVTALKLSLTQFAKGRESLSINKITLADVEMFLDSKNLASRASLRSRLSTLFNFAVRRGYRLDNPCKRLEPIRTTYRPPEIFKTAQFKAAVQWIEANAPLGLAWFALSCLCGLRPEEAEQTTAKEIHFGEGYVVVEAQTTKVRQRRVVYPREEAMAFLKWARDNGGNLPLDPQVRKRMIAGVVWKSKDGTKRRPGLRDALGFKAWPKDITRHTAASYWLASGVSAATVSEMLGNSERVLKRDYKALVTRAQAEEFWKAVAEFTSNQGMNGK